MGRFVFLRIDMGILGRFPYLCGSSRFGVRKYVLNTRKLWDAFIRIFVLTVTVPAGTAWPHVCLCKSFLFKFGKSRELAGVNGAIKYLDYGGYKANAV